MGTKLRVMTIACGITAVAILAGCGNSSSSSSSSTTASTPAPATGGASGAAAAVDVGDNSDLGQILVDGDGRTLYLFEKDDSADESYCNGSCAKVWPPLTTKGAPTAGSGIDASKLSTFKRDDGSTQVVFDGHPLYTYVDDKQAGDASGNELDQFGAEWYALTPSGENAEGGGGGGGSSNSGSGGGGGGGGYSY